MSINISALHYNDNVDVKEGFSVNNAGYVKVFDADSHICRPGGRYDYQLLYVKAGKAHFYNGQKNYTLGSGHVFLYRPGQPQIYEYCAADRTEIYWIHFGGRRTDEVLKSAGLENVCTADFGGSGEFVRVTECLIRELREQSGAAKLGCAAKLIGLITDIGRSTRKTADAASAADADFS